MEPKRGLMNRLTNGLIGGVSGTKEFAFFVFLIYMFGAVGVFGTGVYMSFSGIEHDLSLAVDFLKFITPWVFIGCFTAFGIGKIGSFGFFGNDRAG